MARAGDGKIREKCSAILRELHVRTCFGGNTRNFLRSLTSLSLAERVEREEQLIRGYCIRVESHERIEGALGVLLRGTREQGDDGSG